MIRRANLVSSLGQFRNQITQAAGGPQQRLHRITPRHRLDQRPEIGNKGRILDNLLPTPAARPADAPDRQARRM
jgi:hypothetical protein